MNLRDSVEMLAVDDIQDDSYDTTSIGEKSSFGAEAINNALMPDLSRPIELKRDFVGSNFTECVTYYNKVT